MCYSKQLLAIRKKNDTETSQYSHFLGIEVNSKSQKLKKVIYCGIICIYLTF